MIKLNIYFFPKNYYVYIVKFRNLEEFHFDNNISLLMDTFEKENQIIIRRRIEKEHFFEKCFKIKNKQISVKNKCKKAKT